MRRLLPTLAVAVLAAGCAGGPPEVVFSARDASTDALPTQYCELDLSECHDDAAAVVVLAVPPGTPLRVEVPEEVAEAPWLVVFTYRDAGGEQVDERSPLFAPGQRSDYVVELADPAARLLTAEVQQLGAPPQANAETGEIEFPARATWVLATTG
jgi:hypothetical protein